MGKKAVDTKLTPRDFLAPIGMLVPPRMPTGHPSNKLRGRILLLLDRAKALMVEAAGLTKPPYRGRRD